MRALLYSSWVPALALACLAGCAVPLGPGYKIEKESLEVRYVPSEPARLAVLATYRLANTGNRALGFVDVTLPGEDTFGRRDLHARVDGQEVPLAAAVDEEGEEVRVPLNPWTQKQRHTVEIEYDLAPPAPSGGQVAVNEGAFYLRPFGWFPDLQEPKGLFARDVVRPDPTEVNVQVPENFLVVSRGQPERAVRKSESERRKTENRPQGAEVEHRFRLRKDDLDPFVVAGRYQEQRVHTPDGSVVFWTLESLPNDQAQTAGVRLAATWKLYQTIFGSISKQSDSAWMIETPASLPSNSRQGDGPAAVALAGVVLLNRQAISTGIASTEFLDLAERAMVGTWFGQQVGLRPEAAWAMKAGLEDYAAMVAAAAQGRTSDRAQKTTALLDEYEKARAKAVEKPLAAMRLTDPPEQRRIAAAKVPLFFLALEDECGEAALRRALMDVVSDLRGQDVGWSDLRVALERRTGKNLAAFFRRWLDQTGIPDEFRKRSRIEIRKSTTALTEGM